MIDQLATSEPIYLRIAQDLRDQISAGDILPGEDLPSEGELMERYGVARGTARQALRTLREDGLVDVVRGRRARVVEAQPCAVSLEVGSEVWVRLIPMSSLAVRARVTDVRGPELQVDMDDNDLRLVARIIIERTTETP